MEESELLQTIRRIVDVLDRASIPYHITGGVSVSVYGEPRSTQDVDIVLHPERFASKWLSFIELIKDQFDFSLEAIASAIQRKGVFQLIDHQTLFKVDCYVRESIPGELSRSVRTELSPTVTANVLWSVDAAVAKLLWIKKGSLRSRRDLQSIFASLSQDDADAVRVSAKNLGLDDLLSDVLAGREPEE